MNHSNHSFDILDSQNIEFEIMSTVRQPMLLSVTIYDRALSSLGFWRQRFFAALLAFALRPNMAT